MPGNDAVHKAYLELLDRRLAECCAAFFEPGSQVGQAARYSLMAGGKRVRGVLCLAFCDLLGGSRQAAADFGCAVEMLHCYSLIHDDLPCMDDAALRRGQPACHKQFGEAVALLAGDALLTMAFECIAASAAARPEQRAAAVACLARAAGGRGMVLGQELDLQFEGGRPSEEELTRVHTHKTGDLICAAGMLGVLASPHTPQDAERCTGYTRAVGLVFQIIDDILDSTATAAQMGKPVGSDAAAGKVTFASLKGVGAARAQAEQLTGRACALLQGAYGSRADFLVGFARSLAVRES